jgi:DNA primase (bacterial type)
MYLAIKLLKINIFFMANDVEEIKSKLDIVELISEYVQLKASGANFRGLCPFHNEKTPFFFCFSRAADLALLRLR